MSTDKTDPVLLLERELLDREVVWRSIFRNPDRVQAVAALVSLMTAVDARTGFEFGFTHLRDPLEEGEVWLEGNALRCRGWDGPSVQRGGDKSWRWQRFVLERRIRRGRRIDLKGRQIGDTWINLAVDVAEALLKPGTDSLLFRQREDEAIDNVRRWWTLYRSLPPWLLARVPAGSKVGPVVVSKPERGDRPGRDGVSLRFCNNVFSDIVPMTSTASSGHGRSTRDIMLDEAAHIEKLLGIRAAVEPAAGEHGSIGLISTANGRSNPETGEGNEFHRVWLTADESGYDRLFLGYYLHPERDEEWYAESPEVQSLPVWKRQEQFPRNEHEAFALSDRVFFDPDALIFYADHVEPPAFRGDFEVDGPRAALVRKPEGRVRVYRRPRPNVKYAVGADVASGRGRDFSSAFVIDLSNGEFAAEYHGKVGEDVYAQDLHFLGRWYNDAIIAPETQGGHGTAVIIALRDGVKGRPPYTKIYRHRNEGRADRPDTETYGMPMTPKNRPNVINQLEAAVRDRTLPFVSADLLHEMSEFVHHNTGTSPRARDGAFDDRVMAAAISLELFRRYGDTMKRVVRRGRRNPDKPNRTRPLDTRRYPGRS